MNTFRIDETGSGDIGPALSAMLAACESAGGVIVIPPGEWFTGPVDIPSDTTLRLEEHSVLLFRDDPALYPPEGTRWEGVECSGFRPLIRARDAINVVIEGQGIIDGNGASWWSLYRNIRNGTLNPADIPWVREIREHNSSLPQGSGGGGRETGFLRPPLAQFFKCRNVRLDGVTFRNSPFWNTHVLYSFQVLIRGCCFLNPPDSPNTDGLNVDSSTDVRIEDCRFDVGDDCLCLKSGSDEDGRRVALATENIVIRGCDMRHGHGGIVLGSEIAGGIRNVIVEDCSFTGTDRGIRIKARRGRGGFVRDLTVRNITMSDVPFPLVVNLYYRCGATEKESAAASSTDRRPADETTPAVGDVRIEVVRATGVRVGAFISGLPESPVGPLHLADWRLHFATGLSGEPDLFEPAMDFGSTRLPLTGFYGRRLKNARLQGFFIDNPEVGVVETDTENEPVADDAN